MHLYWNAGMAAIEVIVDGKWYIVYPDGETEGGHEVDIYWHDTRYPDRLHSRYTLYFV